jgi:hypothetical protein
MRQQPISSSVPPERNADSFYDEKFGAVILTEAGGFIQRGIKHCV